jgi:hypothetical protein
MGFSFIESPIFLFLRKKKMIQANHEISITVNGEQVDIYSVESLNLRINNVVFNPVSVSSKTGEYSFSFELPATARNNRIFGYANNSAKTGLATSINALQTKIGTFKDTYKIGTDASTLGNRGKAEGSVTKEVGDIETALSALKGKNDAVVTTVVSEV